MKKLLIFCLLALIFSIDAYSDIFYLKYYDGSVTRIMPYSAVVVKNRSGVVIFRGRTDRYGRVKIIATSGTTMQVTYNGRNYTKNSVTIRNNEQRTTLTFTRN